MSSSESKAALKPRILCVDDEAPLLRALSNALRRSYEVLTAASAEEGLEVLERESPIDVVLSDMRMPGMNGAEFLSIVRERYPDTMRVLLTGFANVDSAIAAVNQGQIFRFLTKPFPPDELRRELAAAVAERKHRLALQSQQRELHRRLDAVDRLQEQFLANVSHELRTPLTSILGSTELLALDSTNLSPKQRDLLDIVEKRGRELLGLLDTTLKAREMPECGTETSGTDLRTFVELLKSSVAELPSGGRIELVWHVPEDVNGEVHTDMARVALAVRSLVDNAYKFTGDGTVTVEVAIEGEEVAIDVRDTGPGIPREYLPHIFGRFQQGDGSSTRRFGGVGLGLYLTKTCIEQLGGTVHVETHEGRGSTFTLRFSGYRDGSEQAVRRSA